MAESASKLRDLYLSKSDIPEEELYVPEWDETVVVRGMDGAARAKFLTSNSDSAGNIDFSKVLPELVIATLWDQDAGCPVFTDKDKDMLMEKSGRALERISSAGARLSGLSEEAQVETGKD